MLPQAMRCSRDCGTMANEYLVSQNDSLRRDNKRVNLLRIYL